jgi:MarR family transcriptional regulator, temperature-dependent positive regulator of motility
MGSDTPAAIEQAKAASTLQLLFKAARLLDERAVARVRAEAAHAAAALRTAHTALFPHIDFTGVRLTELAQKVGSSKQAVGQLVDDLEAMGVVERIADPADGRAKRIRFSRRGQEAMLHGLAVLRQMEAELAAEIGAAGMESMRAVLVEIVAREERRGSETEATGAPVSVAATARRSRSRSRARR